jgi:CyaY protein
MAVSDECGLPTWLSVHSPCLRSDGGVRRALTHAPARQEPELHTYRSAMQSVVDVPALCRLTPVNHILIGRSFSSINTEACADAGLAAAKVGRPYRNTPPSKLAVVGTHSATSDGKPLVSRPRQRNGAASDLTGIQLWAEIMDNAWLLEPRLRSMRPATMIDPTRSGSHESPVGSGDYDRLASGELQRLLLALDAVEDTVDTELSDGILSLEFSDGARYLVNSHRAARQIWMAANTKAWHFDYDPQSGRWVAGRSSAELWTTLSGLLSEKLKKPISLRRATEQESTPVSGGG